MRRWVVRVVVSLLVVWLGVVVWGFAFAWRSPPTYRLGPGAPECPPFMSMAEYGEVIDTHARPFIVRLGSESGGELVLFGASHTRDPADPQIAAIENEWEALDPTVALVESRLGILFPGFMNPVRTFGEPGRVAALARRGSASLYTWEPDTEASLAPVLETYERDDVALFFILRPYFSNLRHGRPQDPEAYVEGYRAERVKWPGLEGSFESVEQIDAYWASRLPDAPDWREVSDERPLPSPLDEIAAAANDARTLHLGRSLLDLVSRGERVFAVCGSSHAVRLEGPLMEALGQVDEGEAQD